MVSAFRSSLTYCVADEHQIIIEMFKRKGSLYIYIIYILNYYIILGWERINLDKDIEEQIDVIWAYSLHKALEKKESSGIHPYFRYILGVQMLEEFLNAQHIQNYILRLMVSFFCIYM